MSSSHPPEDSSTWRPLGARLAGNTDSQTLHEGVPAWIRSAIESWLFHQLHSYPETADRLFARLQYPATENSWFFGPDTSVLSQDDLLDWVDAVLHISCDRLGWKRDAERLEAVLREGRSAWRVSDDLSALERRQDATVTATTQQAQQAARISGRQSAAEHLEKAWHHVYGLHPDPSRAYGEAILAVEATAVPIVIPNDVGAHLGHVYGQLKSQGHLYELAITEKAGKRASVTVVTEMIGLLWHGHTDRHEGNVPGIPITNEAAQMAVHAAATLVQWFTSGAVRRKSQMRPRLGRNLE